MDTGKLNQFDRVAPYYDRLADFIFQGSIQKAQEYFLTNIPEGSKVLVLGGGSGRLLHVLLKIVGVHVSFVETSKVMIDIATRRSGSAENVRFIHGDIRSVSRSTKFDVVITPFFLDVFSNEALVREVGEIGARTNKEKVMWFVTDFITDAHWKRLFAGVMYFFFRITCGISTQRLPDWQKALSDFGLGEKQVALFYKGFIKTALYEGKSRC